MYDDRPACPALAKVHRCFRGGGTMANKKDEEPVQYIFECMQCGLAHEFKSIEKVKCPRCGSHNGIYQPKTEYLKNKKNQPKE